MSFWSDWFNKRGPRRSGEHSGVAAYEGLRQLALGITHADLPGVDRGQSTLALLMEWHQTAAVVTLACIADGTVSLYFSTGGGILGSGQHDAVREEARRFLQMAGSLAALLAPADDCPLPAAGDVRFYAVTDDGIQSARAAESDLVHKRSDLSPLFHAGSRVITAIRTSSS